MEVCSDDSARVGQESDYYRLLFQGASLVLLLNWLTESQSTILPLVYVDKNFQARIYMIYEEDPKVLLNLTKSLLLVTKFDLGVVCSSSKLPAQ